MSDIVQIQTILKDWKNISAVMPSSSFVVQRLCGHMDFAKARVMVEYGPGTGVVTKAILQRMRADARLIAIELNPSAAAHLKHTFRDPRLIVHEDSAENVQGILQQSRAGPVDYVVSCIPFFWTEKSVRERIIAKSHDVIKEGGRFLALQIWHVPAAYLKNHLQGRFREVRSEVEYWNLPPLRMYDATK